MLRERPSGHLAHAVNDIEHAGRETRVESDLCKQPCGERTPLRWLVNHRAPRGERWRDLPGGQHERRVPRCDHPDRADSSARRVVEMMLRRQRQTVCGGWGAIREEPEVLCAASRC